MPKSNNETHKMNGRFFFTMKDTDYRKMINPDLSSLQRHTQLKQIKKP